MAIRPISYGNLRPLWQQYNYHPEASLVTTCVFIGIDWANTISLLGWLAVLFVLYSCSVLWSLQDQYTNIFISIQEGLSLEPTIQSRP